MAPQPRDPRPPFGGSSDPGSAVPAVAEAPPSQGALDLAAALASAAHRAVGVSAAAPARERLLVAQARLREVVGHPTRTVRSADGEAAPALLWWPVRDTPAAPDASPWSAWAPLFEACLQGLLPEVWATQPMRHRYQMATAHVLSVPAKPLDLRGLDEGTIARLERRLQRAMRSESGVRATQALAETLATHHRLASDAARRTVPERTERVFQLRFAEALGWIDPALQAAWPTLYAPSQLLRHDPHRASRAAWGPAASADAPREASAREDR